MIRPFSLARGGPLALPGKPAIALITVALCAAGCGVQTTVQEVRQAQTDLGDDAIVILSRKHKTQGETEDDFVACVSAGVNGGNDGLPVLPARDFVDATFPWFEPRTAPRTMDDLAGVIGRPLISERIQEIGVRYLVWIEGTTQRSDESGTLQCTVVSGGIPACFGFLSWENGSNYEASVWDVYQGMNVGTLSSEASGTSFVPAVVVPLPFIARVRQAACTKLSDQIKGFLGPTA
ncbi:MAG: hypothetical protein OXG82_20445 [Gammaproteobacteria bacterium]|nr:hypothetical protein [Gammaproteobacteria bacterium]